MSCFSRDVGSGSPRPRLAANSPAINRNCFSVPGRDCALGHRARGEPPLRSSVPARLQPPHRPLRGSAEPGGRGAVGPEPSLRLRVPSQTWAPTNPCPPRSRFGIYFGGGGYFRCWSKPCRAVRGTSGGGGERRERANPQRSGGRRAALGGKSHLRW